MELETLITRHDRSFADNRFVYPVISRRSGGLSLGINLNPDKICNFDCIYCQVNRVSPSETRFVETDDLLRELRELAELAASGEIYRTERFSQTPEDWRRLNDFAFSGDGEPTTYKNFDEIMTVCAKIKRELDLDEVKMVLITNASMFHRPHVRRGLEVLDRNQGEIWAKLDAGTEAYYRLVDRTSIPFSQVLENITQAACVRPLVIQALFMRVNGEGPTAQERAAFCERLNQITAAGGQLKLIQIYTVARPPAESWVTPLPNDEVDAFVELVRQTTGLPAAGFYGASA